MKRYIKPIVTALLLGAGASALYAIPAKKGLFPFTQADGTVIEVELTGDEFAHCYLSPDGYPLVEKNGTLYYAGFTAAGALEASDLRVAATRSSADKAFLAGVDKSKIADALRYNAEKSPLRRNAGASGMMRAPQGPGLDDGSDFPVTGSPRVLVILAEYSDVKMTVANPHDYFSRMMMEPGFSDYGGTGSAIDFFTENSNGQFTPQIDVYGPVTLPQKQSYYGANDYNGDDRNAAQMIADACEALDSQIDFSLYDTNKDGYIDNVFVFYAGRGEANGGGANTVWPHKWNVTYAGINKSFDGVKLDRYACSNEWMSGRPDGVGTFIHEFSHVMGLPDLYSTNYSSAFTPGEWSTLDYGPYNNDGCTPPLYSAFERYALGWIEPVLIDSPVTAELPSIGENVCGIIKTAKENEYFLLENRQQVSWDKYIPGHGMLIWHIDYNASIWSRNAVNNSSSHQYVDIEEADNTRSEYSRAGDAFPGTGNVTSFTDDTAPSMKTWSGARLNLPITDIAESAGVISFNVAGGKATGNIDKPVALAATAVETDRFTANWEAVEGLNYLLSVYSLDGAGKPVYTAYNRTNVGAVSSVIVENLEQDTQYYYTVTAMSGFSRSEVSDEIAVRTRRMSIDYFPVKALDATAVAKNSFVANWEALPDAVEYELTVNELTMGDPLRFSTGFDDKLLPAGWSASSWSLSGMANRYGKASPAITIQAGNYMETPDYGDIYTVAFWHRANSQAAGVIKISGKIGGEWTDVRDCAIEKAVGGVTHSVELPAGVSAVRISYAGTVGSVAIDDIELSYGHDILRMPLEAYTAVNVGNVTSYAVEGLEPGHGYSYTVRASDGSLKSKESVEIRVTTAGTSGIAGITADETFTVVVEGGVIAVRGVDASAAVALFDIAGREIGSGRGESTFAPDTKGVYIVRVGSASAKVVIR